MQQGDVGPIDLDKTTTTLEPEETSSGGLFVPGKERVVFQPPERKSLLGLDVLAIAKRGRATVESGIKVPRDRVDEEICAASVADHELGSSAPNVNVQRKYRESCASEASISGSIVTDEREDPRTAPRPHLKENSAASSGSFRSSRESVDRERDRIKYSRAMRRGRSSWEEHRYRDSSREYDVDGGRKRSRLRRTPGRSEWDDGRSNSSSRRYEPSPSPMFLGASPDVSPWLGDRTPHSSPWDSVAPSPTIRPSGSSVRDGSNMSLAQSKRSSQLTADNAQWEDPQLLRSGAVKGTEVQTDFDDEDELKVILLVHDSKPPFFGWRTQHQIWP